MLQNDEENLPNEPDHPNAKHYSDEKVEEMVEMF